MTAEIIDLGERRDAAAEALLRERPSLALPDPADLCGPVAYDCETSGLYFDAGHRVAAVGAAYRLRSDPDAIYSHGFAFDQGRAADKGFTIQYYEDTPTNRRNKVVGLPKGDPHGRWDWDTDYNLPREEWDTLCAWLRDAGKAVGLLNQNIKFDDGMMRAGTRHWPGIELEKWIRWDPMLASPRIWPRLGTNALKPIGAIMWGDSAVEEAQVVKETLIEVKKRFGATAAKRYDLLPWQANGPYVAQDTVLALMLSELQECALTDGYAPVHHIDKAMQVCRVLTRMERRGFGPFDVKTSTEIADRIDAKIEELKATLPFSPASGSRAAVYFFEELGMAPWNDIEQARVVEVVPDTRKYAQPGSTQRKVKFQGDLSTPVARRMAEAGVPHADAWAQITELSIANKMFYRNYADLAGPDDRLRTNFRQAHVRSDRLSVERFQAQAMPKKVTYLLDGELLPQPRSFFGVREGYRRMNLDLGQAELRIASHFAGCTVMSTAVASGADFHSQTTKRVYQVDETNPNWLVWRDMGKRLTFASIFQIGGVKYQKTLWEEAGLYLPISECFSAVYAWRATYPEFGTAYYQWMDFAERNDYVPLVDGTPSWLTGPRDYPSSAWNRVVQGSLAVFANDWIVEIEKATARYEALVLTVHDSCVLELPEDVADDVCAELAVMTEQMWIDRFGIPGKCDVGPWDK